MPTKAHETDACFDLYASRDRVVLAGSRCILHTDISIAFPKEYVCVFKDRSGLAAKHGLTVLAGVIDSGYRGEYRVVLFNTSSEDYVVKKGDRITQLLFLQLPSVKLVEVDDLEDGARSNKGFGSSGK